MWALGAVLSFIANKGNQLFKSEQQARAWKGGKSTLDSAIYGIDIRQLIADLLCPTPKSRPTAEEVTSESQKDNRQNQPTDSSYQHNDKGYYGSANNDSGAAKNYQEFRLGKT